jgi:hypothetical protein
MELQLLEHNGHTIATVDGQRGAIQHELDALDLMAAASVEGASIIVVPKDLFAPAFYELQSGVAGAILQKFVNYGMRLAILGDFDAVESTSLRAFIFESNRGRHFCFCPDLERALLRLTT